MNNQNQDRLKIGVVLILLVLLLAGLLYVRSKKETAQTVLPAVNHTVNQVINVKTRPIPISSPTPTLDPTMGMYIIDPVNSKISIGEEKSFSVNFFTKGRKLDGADVILKFDPVYLEASQTLQVGDFFSSFPRQEIDNTMGTIKVSGFSWNNEANVKEPITLFSVNIKGKKKGKSILQFDFQRGVTRYSTLVEKGTSKNILGSVGISTVTVE